MLTVSNATGDGVNQTLIVASIELPDSGTTANVDGQVQAVGSPAQTITGSVTIPAAPGSGSIFYVLQANLSTGAVTVKQSTSATPTADAGNVVIFSQTLVPGQTDPALVPEVTPDTF